VFDLVEIDDYYIDPRTYVAEWENTPRCLSAALSYAEIGWQVFPAPRGTKKSHKSQKHSGGRKWGKTTDAAEIRSDYVRWPEANVGVATGEESNIFVVDTDTLEGHGVDGNASLQELERQNGKLPVTLTSMSPSGSIHRIYKYPRGRNIENSASEIAPGIDVRGEGGMILAPPSVMPGKGAYVFLNNVAPVDAPEWFLELTARPPKPGRPEQEVSDAELNADASEIAAALAIIPSGINYPAWFEICCALRHELGEAGFKLFDGW